MIAGQPFLPLFFNTEDEDLWLKLQKLPAEKRSEVTKQALREFLQDHSDLIQASSEDVLIHDEVFQGDAENDVIDKKEDQVICENDEQEDVLYESPRQVEFSLESLFEMSPVEAKPDPIQNLLSIIGEEEDEEVIRLFGRANDDKEE
jgi:hypothetical protein